MYRSLQFQKCSQDFIGTHNETLSVIAVCVGMAARLASSRNGLAIRVRVSTIYKKESRSRWP
jgi:hypothetical protein